MQLLALLLNFEHKKRKVDVGRWVLGGGSPLTFSGSPVTASYNTLTPLVTISGCFVDVLQIYLRFVFKISHYRPLPLSIGLNGPEFRHSFFIGPESDHCLLLSVTH